MTCWKCNYAHDLCDMDIDTCPVKELIYEKYEEEAIAAGFEDAVDYLDFMCDDVFGVSVDEALKRGLL